MAASGLPDAGLGSPPADHSEAARRRLRRELEERSAALGAGTRAAGAGVDAVAEVAYRAGLEAADLGPLLSVLPVSATGQRQSAAVSLLSAPRQGGRMHVVLVDAGRRALLGDPVLREALACIRCGACMNVCPVFRTCGGHAYGGPYPGPLGLMILEALGAGRGDPDLPFLCTLCGACDEVCPVRIPITDAILELRRRHVEDGRAGLVQGLGLHAFGLASSRPRLWSTAGRILDRVLERGAAPGPLGRWARGRALPRPGRGGSR